MQARAALGGESNLERRIAVNEALGEVAELPQMQRAAIFLTAVDGQTHDEVADALGISHGALRGLLYRARATLRTAAAVLTPSPLLASASGGAGVAAPSAERLAELAAGGGAGFAGVLLKGAVVAVTAGALATGAGVVANHGRESASRPRGAARATVIVAPARVRESPRAVGAASTVALVELRSTHQRRGENAPHGKRSTGARAAHGERHRHGDSHGGVTDGGRVESSPRGESRGGGGSAGVGDGENAGGSNDRGGSSTAPGSTGDSSGRARTQSPSGDRRSGSDGSRAIGAEVSLAAAGDVVQPAAPPQGGQTSGEQSQGGGSGNGSSGSSSGESSRSDG